MLRDDAAARSDSVSLIDLAAMPGAHDEHKEALLLDLVNDPVVTGSGSPLAGSANEPRCCGRSWFGGEQFDGSLDATAYLRIERAQLPRRGRGQCDLGGHARPRSPLTSSHGIGVAPASV
jgi:hypothetical protein